MSFGWPVSKQDVGLVAAAELIQANILAATRPLRVRARDHSDGDLQRAGTRRAAHYPFASGKLLGERRAETEVVAEHLMKTGTVDQEWAVGALHEAGRASTRKGAPAAAIRYLRRAVESPMPTRCRRGCSSISGWPKPRQASRPSLDRFANALEMVNDPGERADALYSLGQTCMRSGAMPRRERRFRRGAASSDDDTQAWLRFRAGGERRASSPPGERIQAEIMRRR